MSKTKQEHIEHWVQSAEIDFDTANYLIEGKRYLHALFMMHLTIEKISKALWVKNNENDAPPKIHNLIKILKESNIEVEFEQLSILNDLNLFQIEGRYATELSDLYSVAKGEYANDLLTKTKKLKEWLLKNLQ